jgi:hypothetical protein
MWPVSPVIAGDVLGVELVVTLGVPELAPALCGAGDALVDTDVVEDAAGAELDPGVAEHDATRTSPAPNASRVTRSGNPDTTFSLCVGRRRYLVRDGSTSQFGWRSGESLLEPRVALVAADVGWWGGRRPASCSRFADSNPRCQNDPSRRRSWMSAAAPSHESSQAITSRRGTPSLAKRSIVAALCAAKIRSELPRHGRTGASAPRCTALGRPRRSLVDGRAGPRLAA